MANKIDIRVNGSQQVVVNDNNSTLGQVIIEDRGSIVITTGRPVTIDRLVSQP